MSALKVGFVVLPMVLMLTYSGQNELNQVDTIREEYLMHEKHLWTLLRVESNRQIVIDKIYDLHNKFEYDKPIKTKYAYFYTFLNRIENWKTLSNYYFKLSSRIPEFRITYGRNRTWDTAKELVNYILHKDHEEQQSMNKIYESMVENDLYNKTVLSFRQDINDFCVFQLTEQQILYEMYKHLSTAELQGFMIIQLAHLLKTAFEEGIGYNDWDDSIAATHNRDLFEARTRRTRDYIRKLMKTLNNDLWRCDNRNASTKLTRLIQGYVDNEVNLNYHGSCWHSCEKFNATRNFGCYEGTYCHNQDDVNLSDRKLVCKGDVVNCTFIDSDMRIYDPTDEGKDHTRRYKQIAYENGLVIGKNLTGYDPYTNVYSWTRGIFRCHQCFCLCDEKGRKSDRFISLRSITTDIRANKVAIGIALIKKDRVISIVLRQGVLEERGTIRPNNRTSRQSNDIRSNDRFVITDRNMDTLNDVYVLTHRNRSIDLDDLIAPDDYVITGARFGLSEQRHIRLEARITKFDFASGKLYPEYTTWISNNYENHTYFKLRSTIVPVRDDYLYRLELLKSHNKFIDHTNTTRIDTRSGQYFDFTYSDIRTDAAQETVPYIDTQEVSTQLESPIGGIGLYHKGRRDSAGFLGVKIFSLNYANYF